MKISIHIHFHRFILKFKKVLKHFLVKKPRKLLFWDLWLLTISYLWKRFVDFPSNKPCFFFSCLKFFFISRNFIIPVSWSAKGLWRSTASLGASYRLKMSLRHLSIAWESSLRIRSSLSLGMQSKPLLQIKLCSFHLFEGLLISDLFIFISFLF